MRSRICTKRRWWIMYKGYEIKKAIEEIIAEHNKIWGNISANLKNYSYPAGHHCFNMKEEDIIVIAAGLARKGFVHEKTVAKD
jgi:hypothetical protein